MVKRKYKYFGEEIAVNAEIEYIEAYSGHADQEFLIEFIDRLKVKPKHIFLTHGEIESLEIFKEIVENKFEINVDIPSFGDSYILKDQKVEKQVVTEHLKLRKQRLEQLDKVGSIDKISIKIDRLVDELKERAIKETITKEEITEIMDKIDEFKSKIEEMDK